MPIPEQVLDALRWRNVGPPRGGRSVAVAGDPVDRATFWFGACSGGVWKTDDGGTYWRNVSDGFLTTASIGAIAVAASDPQVVVAGTGEACVRNNVVPGDGVYRTTDGGQTWRHLGLAETRHIPRVRIHPSDPDTIWVAALGDIFGPNPERGVFRTRDGGRTWDHVLHVTDEAGAADLWLDPTNPRILFATIWQARRTPWSMSSGGEHSGLWRSRDGGDTWEDITRNQGLPSEALLGRIGVCASPARPSRVWAVVEATDDQSGVYRSEDRGDTWTRVSTEQGVLGRPWYYMHLVPDPVDPETLYSMNFAFHRSDDGGVTWKTLQTPHGDNHDLWIDPADPQRMIEANDGGACVSYNGGRTFSTIYNQVTSQIYRMAIEPRFPYRVVGTQQDNSAISVPSATDRAGIVWGDCYQVGFSESGDIDVHPQDPDIVVSGAVGSAAGGGGSLRAYDHRTGQSRLINVWPQAASGVDPSTLRHRFPWTYPVLFSRHDPSVLYVGGERLFRSRDVGHSWEAISPDLTHNAEDKLRASGGPITKDTSGAEIYCTLHSLAESPHDPATLWVGTDDGRLHRTTDGGASWTEVTPPGLPEWATIQSVEVSPHDPATVYVAAHAYRLQDRAPYAFRSRDAGETWQLITGAIPEGEWIRVVRCDRARAGLLYAGTERGVRVSLDDGESWQPLGGAFPTVPVYDLKVHGANLAVASHGRGFWILDDLTPLREWSDEVPSAPATLFSPPDTYRRALSDIDRLLAEEGIGEQGTGYLDIVGGPAVDVGKDADGRVRLRALDGGLNPPAGVTITYHLAEAVEELALTVHDAEGTELTRFRSKKPTPPKGMAATPAAAAADQPPQPPPPPGPEALTIHPSPAQLLPTTAGLHHASWDLSELGVRTLPDEDLKVRVGIGPQVPPGTYTVRLTVGGHVSERPFAVLPDPRITASEEDLRVQHELLRRIVALGQELVDAILVVRKVKGQARAWSRRRGLDEEVASAAHHLAHEAEAVERRLTNPDITHMVHGLQKPAGLDSRIGQLAVLVMAADARPTRQAEELFALYADEADEVVGAVRQLVEGPVADLNRRLVEAGIPPIDTAVPPLEP